MRLSHHPAFVGTLPRPFSTKRAQQPHGYVLAMFGLLLVPLLLLVGFSVDVGSWYNRASQMQKAADSAALAGVVWLPDVVKAKQYALEAAKRNGFEHGVDDVTVTVEQVVGRNRRLRVRITDTSVGSFFYTKLSGKYINLTRKATAEYVMPVPLGSPENQFGGGAYSDPTKPAANQPNLWGNIHGPRTDNIKGDAYAPACRSSDNCTSISNDAYRPSGYLYAIDVPSGVTGLDIRIFDGGLYDRGANESVETGDRKYTSTGTTTTTWTVYNRDATELDVNDNPTALSTGLCTSGSGTWVLAEGANASTHKGQWVRICYVGGTVTPGRYLLRVQTSGTGSAANRYAIRATTSTGAVRVSAYGDMSMYNNVAAGNATFYLAEVDPVHAGKTLEISLYDPGEVSKTSTTTGNGTVQVLTNTGAVAASCTGSSSNNVIAANLTPCQFQSASGGNSNYNGAWVTLGIKIPNNYSCTMGTVPGCWWKIKYIIDGQGNDTTTWAAQVIGDPVHLIEEDA